MNDLRLSGSQQIGGGEYAKVRCSGSVKINGNLKCDSMHISGSCHSTGDIDCANEIELSGSFRADGNVKADKLEHSGSATFKSFEGKTVSSSGSLDIKDALKSEYVKMSGSVSCSELSADKLEMSGKLVVSGQINVDHAELYLASLASSSAESVVGSDILIRRHRGSSLFGLIKTIFKTKTIEGDNIELNCVEADCVRGENVKIGDKCIIGRVEYSKECNIDPRAQVRETAKI